MNDISSRIKKLGLWKGSIDPQPITGGMTNENFLVEDDGKKFFVRLGENILHHHVMRFNEHAISEAAYLAGISPKVVYKDSSAMVLEFIEGKSYSKEDINSKSFVRIIDLLKRCHNEIPKYLRGPVLSFSVFHIMRDYCKTLDERSSRWKPDLKKFIDMADLLEKNVGKIDLVLGHNDLMCANFIDDGKRLWLVDWEYAGFNTPLFDLGGISLNAELEKKDVYKILELYFQKKNTDELLISYHAMECATALRETMWSMIAEIFSKIDINYAEYTDTNIKKFYRMYDDFKEMI